MRNTGETSRILRGNCEQLASEAGSDEKIEIFLLMRALFREG